MIKYRKIPVVVDAEQFFVDQKPWPMGVSVYGDGEQARFYVTTPHGDIRVNDGDWIIPSKTYPAFYLNPCKPDIFEQTYEKIE